MLTNSLNSSMVKSGRQSSKQSSNRDHAGVPNLHDAFNVMPQNQDDKAAGSQRVDNPNHGAMQKEDQVKKTQMQSMMLLDE